MNQVTAVAARVGMGKPIAEVQTDLPVVGVLDERAEVVIRPRADDRAREGELHLPAGPNGPPHSTVRGPNLSGSPPYASSHLNRASEISVKRAANPSSTSVGKAALDRPRPRQGVASRPSTAQRTATIRA